MDMWNTQGARNRLDRLASRLHSLFSRNFPLRPFHLPEGQRIVTFTFDDAPDSAESNGARILEKYGVRGVYYISGGLVGTHEKDRSLISEDGCRRLGAAGHEIACHTFAHHHVPMIGLEELAADLDRNAAFLRRFTPDGEPPRDFAFPYCASSVRTRRLFADRFATCRGGGGRINRGDIDLSFLGAVEIRQPEAEAAAQTKWIDDLAENPGWLIFYTHDVSDTPTPYGCTPETFERLVAHAVESGAAVLTIRQAMERMQPLGDAA